MSVEHGDGEISNSSNAAEGRLEPDHISLNGKDSLAGSPAESRGPVATESTLPPEVVESIRTEASPVEPTATSDQTRQLSPSVVKESAYITDADKRHDEDDRFDDHDEAISIKPPNPLSSLDKSRHRKKHKKHKDGKHEKSSKHRKRSKDRSERHSYATGSARSNSRSRSDGRQAALEPSISLGGAGTSYQERGGSVTGGGGGGGSLQRSSSSANYSVSRQPGKLQSAFQQPQLPPHHSHSSSDLLAAGRSFHRGGIAGDVRVAPYRDHKIGREGSHAGGDRGRRIPLEDVHKRADAGWAAWAKTLNRVDRERLIRDEKERDLRERLTENYRQRGELQQPSLGGPAIPDARMRHRGSPPGGYRGGSHASSNQQYFRGDQGRPPPHARIGPGMGRPMDPGSMRGGGLGPNPQDYHYQDQGRGQDSRNWTGDPQRGRSRSPVDKNVEHAGWMQSGKRGRDQPTQSQNDRDDSTMIRKRRGQEASWDAEQASGLRRSDSAKKSKIRKSRKSQTSESEQSQQSEEEAALGPSRERTDQWINENDHSEQNVSERTGSKARADSESGSSERSKDGESRRSSASPANSATDDGGSKSARKRREKQDDESGSDNSGNSSSEPEDSKHSDKFDQKYSKFESSPEPDTYSNEDKLSANARKRLRSYSDGEHSDTPEHEQILSEEEISEEETERMKAIKALPKYFPGISGCRSVEEFSCLNRIEEGTYGVVYRSKDKRTDEIVALKRLKMEKEKEGFPITSIREINTLLKSQHENIVTVREIVVGSNMDKIYIVMDYVEHDLKNLMETMKQPFLIGEVKTLLRQLLSGVHHLHDNWILHRDLKTSNLLLSHKGVLKIGDFGLAREYGSPLKPYTAVVVTLWYRAPELLLGIKEYSTKVDMWSVGCIFGELLNQKPLFPGKGDIDQLNKIFKDLGTPSEKIWVGFDELPAIKKGASFQKYPYNSLRSRFNVADLSDKGFRLINKFLTYDPNKRISASEALGNDWFLEDPPPVPSELFPTWPAKSEQSKIPTKKPHDSSPKPPSGGKQYYNQLGEADDSLMKDLNLKPHDAPPSGFNLRFDSNLVNR